MTHRLLAFVLHACPGALSEPRQEPHRRQCSDLGPCCGPKGKRWWKTFSGKAKTQRNSYARNPLLSTEIRPR